MTRRERNAQTLATNVAFSSASSSTTCSFNRDNLSRLFLRVSEQLEALQTRPYYQDDEKNTSILRLPSRARAHEIIQKNQRFRPSDELRRPCDDMKATTPNSALFNRKGSTMQLQSTSALTNQTQRLPVFVPVGGRARVIPPGEFARAKLVLRKRSLALTNLKADAITASHEGSPGLFRSSSSANIADKQALVTELVQHTHFTTEHIFQMSRKFKEIGGLTKSTISLIEFRQMMSDDIGVLLHNVGVNTLIGSNVDLNVVSTTIANSDSFLRRLFHTFDRDGNGKIDFREFVLGLNGFASSTLEDKVSALFEVYGNGDNPTIEGDSKVAISNILGLFQGDRKLYQELMRCVDEYFVRTELRDEGSITEEEFVTASVSAPRLLETITRPIPSQLYKTDARLREVLRCYADQKQLTWRKMLEIHRRIFALRALSGNHSEFAVTEVEASLPLAQFHLILAECCGTPQSMDDSNISGGSSNPLDLGDDPISQQLLRAYTTIPHTIAYADSLPTVDPAVPFVPHIYHIKLMQDFSVVLHSMLLPETETDFKAKYYFEWFDLNHDGTLSRSELISAVCAGFAHFGQHVTEVVRVLEGEDQDQDGELTKQEYLNAAARSPLIFTSLYTCFPQEMTCADIHTEE